jgi:L-rhamnose mutarotase
MKIRKAFVMSVNAGAEHEYEKRHNPIWPELEKVLKDHGVSNYSIFLHPETRQLFGYAEVQSEVQWALIDLRGVAKGGGNTWAMLGCLCRLTGTCKMVNCIT